VLGGDQTLNVNGSDLSGFSHILADPFTGGLIDTDMNGSVGILDKGTSGITVNLPNAGTSLLNFGNGHDVVTLGDGNNIVNFGSGNDSFTAGNGNNHVSIGYGSAVTGGLDTLSFGSGANTVDFSFIDTLSNNSSGSSITFAAHGTNVDTIDFNDVNNSQYSVPVTINGFQAATDLLHFNHQDLDNSTHFDLVFVTSDAGAIAAVNSDSGAHATFVYNETTGHLFVDADANHVLNSNDMEITLVGIPAITTANIHIA
jgi:Ca2+-binding RTX toxin-like protein